MGSILSPVSLSPGTMARLSLLALVVLIANCSGSSLRIERDADACDQLREEVTTCTMNAYKEYQNDFLAGEDGRPDWFARKACNYLTASIEDCYGKLIGDCATEEDVNDMRDQAIPGVLGQLSGSMEEWDSEKCPVVKNHLDRVKEETSEDDDAQVESAAQKEEENDEEEEKEEEEAEETQTAEAPEDSADNSENENPDDTETNGEEEVQDTTTGESVEEESTETGNGEKGEDEGPESSTEAAVASLSLVLVGYIMCSA